MAARKRRNTVPAKKTTKRGKALPTKNQAWTGRYIPPEDAEWGKKVLEEFKDVGVKERGQTRKHVKDKRGRFIKRYEAEDGRKLLDPTFGGTTPTKRSSAEQRKRHRQAEARFKLGKLPVYDKRDDAEEHKERGEVIHQTVFAYMWRLDSKQHARSLIEIIADRYGKECRVRVSVGYGFGHESNWVGCPFDYPGPAMRYLNVWHEKGSSQPVIEGARGEEKVWYEVELLLKEKLDRELYRD